MTTKITSKRWLNHYYGSLRCAHSYLKDVYYADDYKLVPKVFDKKIIQINKLLYDCEKIAVRKAE